ncbi:MAG: adenosylcobinamide-GDP ribazoletransferase [Rhizobiaceae bacterium]
MHALIAKIKSSTVFLSRLPLRINEGDEPLDFSGSSPTFPIAGLIIALPIALFVLGASSLSLPDVLTAILAVALSVLVTGGLHEDGLADTIDGFWGGHTVERRLEIMRDSSIGTYGVIALVLSLMMRTSMIYLILNTFDGPAAALILIAVFSLSRTAMLLPWSRLPPARQNAEEGVDTNGKETSGLSARFGSPDSKALGLALVYSIPAIVILIGVSGPVSTVVALFLALLAAAAMIHLASHHVGGHTGDILGATQQLSELGLLLGLVWTM